MKQTLLDGPGAVTPTPNPLGISLIAPMGPTDPVMEHVEKKRRRALGMALARVAERRPLAADLAALVDALSPEAFRDICLNPFFSRWLHAFIAALQAPEARLDKRLDELGNLLLAPAVREGVAEGRRLRLDATPSGIATLFDRRAGGKVHGLAETPEARCDADAVTLPLADGGRLVLPATVLCVPTASAPPAFRPFRRLRGRTIVVESNHPWIDLFFAGLNEQDRIDREADLRPAELSDDDLSALARGLDIAAAAWPAMAAETDALVTQIAPFASSWRNAFTNTSWQGLVFLNADLSDIVKTVDRVTHETSHLRLNLIQTLGPLHEWPRDKALASPFRTGRRPVDGVYHGVFVFARVCLMLERVYAHCGNPAFLEPIDTMRRQILAGLDALRDLGGATPLGAQLMAEVREAEASLGQRRGLA